MKALLLAAGLGTRLKPFTNTVPKCLIRIHKKPLLEYWLELLLTDHSISQVLINTHYLSNQVEEFVKSSAFKEKISLVHEIELLGTAGTILQNKDFFNKEAFLVAHADNLTRFNVKSFIEAHQKRPLNVEITMMTFETDQPQSSGIIELDEKGLVREFHEKSPIFRGNRANAAVYILEFSVVQFIASLGKKIVDMSTEVLPHYLGRMQVFHNSNYHRDIGTPHSLQLAEIEF